MNDAHTNSIPVSTHEQPVADRATNDASARLRVKTQVRAGNDPEFQYVAIRRH